MNLEIATRLAQLRKANGLSQEALAEKLGISRQATSNGNVKCGKRHIRFKR